MQAEKVTSNVPIHSAKWKQIYFLFHQSKKERSIWACTHSENVMSLVCQFITDIGRYNSSHNEAVWDMQSFGHTTSFSHQLCFEKCFNLRHLMNVPDLHSVCCYAPASYPVCRKQLCHIFASFPTPMSLNVAIETSLQQKSTQAANQNKRSKMKKLSS